MAHATTPLYSAPPVIWPGMPTGIACMLIHQWLISCDPFLKKCVEWLSLPVQVVFFFTAFFLCSWQRTWCWCTDALPCLVHDMVLLCISVPYWCTSVHLPMHCRALCTTCGADALMHRCTAVPCARRVVLRLWCTDALMHFRALCTTCGADAPMHFRALWPKPRCIFPWGLLSLFILSLFIESLDKTLDPQTSGALKANQTYLCGPTYEHLVLTTSRTYLW